MKTILICLLLLFGCSESESVSPASSDTESLATLWFTEAANHVGINHSYYSGAEGHFYIIETMGGGVALFDCDNDGDLDMYLTQGNVLNGSHDDTLVNKFYVNSGDGHFVDQTVGSGADDSGYGIGVATGDYNNDGWVDLFVTNYGRNALLRNNGNLTFTDVTEEAGLTEVAFSACASFADLDLDGDLDLFVTNYLDWTTDTEKPCFSEQNRQDYCNPASYGAPIADTFYINNGDGTFSNATQLSGIGLIAGTGLGVGIAPLNEDNLPDIFVANDGMKDHLWINSGDGTFTEEALVRGCAVDNTGKEKASMGVLLRDLNRDQSLDVLVTTLFRETDSLFVNEDGVFVDSTARFGLAADTRTFTRWGVVAEDFNNDGIVDIYEATGRVRWQADNWDPNDWLAEPNLLFAGSEGDRFTLVAPSGGTSEPLVYAAHGVASGDLDNDGGMDLVIINKDAEVNILLNAIFAEGNWIILEVLNSFGSPALGAYVEVELENGSVYSEYIQTQQGYASSSDPRVHLGLGSASSVRGVRIKWADGSHSSFEGLEAGLIHQLRQ